MSLRIFKCSVQNIIELKIYNLFMLVLLYKDNLNGTLFKLLNSYEKYILICLSLKVSNFKLHNVVG